MYFSVIVPVYGTEPYLPACVDSILHQDFLDFEVILVDDGSPDGCPALCDSYAEADHRVTVLHQPNGGLVSARKAGLAAASGHYIVPVDSDDRLAPGFLRAAHTLIQETDPDIAAFAIRYMRNDGPVEAPEPLEPGLYEGERLSVIRERMLLTPNMQHLHYYVWGKVFRQEILRPCQEKVDSAISMGEDVACLIPAYLTARRVVVSDTVACLCRVHPSSMSRQFRPSHFDDITRVLQRLREVQSEAPADFPAAVDRYGAFLTFVLLATAAAGHDRTAIRALQSHRNGPLKAALKKARFAGITPKSRVAVYLLRHGCFTGAYLFLRLCSRLKERKT